MQVTPDAGRYVCKTCGASFDLGRMKTDPVYNAALGAAELGGLIEDYRGSYITDLRGLQCRPRQRQEMDRALWRSARSQGRRGRLGRTDPVLRDPQLRAADHGEFAGLSRAIRRRNAAADRGRPAPRRKRGIGNHKALKAPSVASSGGDVGSFGRESRIRPFCDDENHRQTLFIGISTNPPSGVTAPDAERKSQARTKVAPSDGYHGDKSDDRQEQFTHHSLLDSPRNGTPPGSTPPGRIFGWILHYHFPRQDASTPAVSRGFCQVIRPSRSCDERAAHVDGALVASSYRAAGSSPSRLPGLNRARILLVKCVTSTWR